MARPYKEVIRSPASKTKFYRNERRKQRILGIIPPIEYTTIENAFEKANL